MIRNKFREAVDSSECPVEGNCLTSPELVVSVRSRTRLVIIDL